MTRTFTRDMNGLEEMQHHARQLFEEYVALNSRILRDPSSTEEDYNEVIKLVGLMQEINTMVYELELELGVRE